MAVLYALMPSRTTLTIYLLTGCGFVLFLAIDSAVPSVPERQSLIVEDLVLLARSNDETVRAMAVEKLLSQLRPGMLRSEVENLIGPPDKDMDEAMIDEAAGMGYTIYYCRPPKERHTQLMSVEYDIRGPEKRFLRVSGPHFPECK